MDRGTGFGRSGHSLQSGPPFVAGSANNGLSVDTVTGKIVLGNDNPGVLANLLSDREIPLNGFGLSFSNIPGDSFADVFANGVFRVHNAAFDADTIIGTGTINITDTRPAPGANGPEIVYSSPAGQVQVRLSATSKVLTIEDTSGPPALALLALNFTNRQSTLGDFNAVGNSNIVFVDDVNSRIQLANPIQNSVFSADLGLGIFLMAGVTGNTMFEANRVTNTYKYGDITGANNGTFLNIDDANSRFVFANTSVGHATFAPQAGDLRIFTTGAANRVFIANNAASDGLLLDSTNRAISSGSGSSTIEIGIAASERVGIQVAAPTAKLHIAAGIAAASGAPLKFTSGTNLTAAEAGAMEWNGTNLFITQTAGPTRKTIAFTTDIPAALVFSTGLTNTAGTITANLSTGIAGGQSAIGGTAAGENLTLSSTSNGTKGKIILGTASAYDQVNDRLGIGTTAPGATLHISTAGATTPMRLTNTTGTAIIQAAGAAMEFVLPGAGNFTVFTNAISQMLSVDGNGVLIVNSTNTPAGTTGNQTINKPSGTVNIAAAGTTVTVTNSLVTTASHVFCQLRTNDATATIKNVVAAAGSFVINLGAAAAAEVSIGFIVFN